MRISCLTAWMALTALALALAGPTEVAARTGPPAGTRLGGPSRAPAIIDNTAHMDANNLDMAVTNHGSIAYDLLTGNPGLIYPKGSTNTVVFAGGLWIAGTVSGDLRAAIGEYSQEFVPGPMAGGTYEFDRPDFRTYRIERDGTGYADYLADAVPQGAPVNGQGAPLLYGDVTLWNVFNDADPSVHTNEVGATLPIGLEVRQTVFGFNRAGPLGNAIFVQWKIYNKGTNTLENAYATAWCDPDLGGPTDDLVGCDTTLALGYCYNVSNMDAEYGASPPSIGLTLLRGAVVPGAGGATDTLGLTSFVHYINGTDPVSVIQTHRMMRGLHRDGTAIHEFDDPLAPVTTYELTGDPAAGTGWTDTNPNDRRMMLSSGPFTMAPGDSQVIFTAIVVGQGSDRLSSISDLRNKVAIIRAFITTPEEPLSVSAPAAVSVNEGQVVAFEVTSYDPDGTASLTASGVPLGATFQDLGNGTGVFDWQPGFDRAGSYTVTFTAHGTAGGTFSRSTDVAVVNVDRPPVANAGGPYTSYLDAAVQFDGTGSADPDGDPLTYAWNFGDDETATGPTPAHQYPFLGTYGVALTVTAGGLSDVATTTAEIVDRYTARAFTANGNRTIRLHAGKPQWCVQVEPVGGSFDILSVDPSSIVLRSSGTGSVDEIHAMAGKGITIADRDANGVEELSVCFGKDDLRTLFGGVSGNQSVPVTIIGSVIGGGEFRAALTVAVVAAGGPLAASFDPNPVSGSGGTLEFVTEQQGRVRVSLFDISGRLVRRVWESAAADVGLHRVPVEARSDAGRPLASGIYFYRIESAEGAASGRVMVLR